MFILFNPVLSSFQTKIIIVQLSIQFNPVLTQSNVHYTLRGFDPSESSEMKRSYNLMRDSKLVRSKIKHVNTTLLEYGGTLDHKRTQRPHKKSI